MNVIDAVRQRRATKKFDPDFVIPLNEKKSPAEPGNGNSTERV